MKQVKIYSNKGLAIMGVLTTAIGVTATTYVSYALISAKDSQSKKGVVYVFIAFFIVGLIVWVSNWPQWFASIVLDENSITTKCGKETYKESYLKYPYVYLGDYYHRGLRPCFIVLAKNELSEYSLTGMNQVPISDKIIKIRYSKKTYETLMEILPEPHRSKVKDVVENAGREVY